MPKENGFRIFGSVLDTEASYCDTEVDGVDERGRIHLYCPSNGNSYIFSEDEIKSLHNEKLLVGNSQIPVPDDQLWTILDNLGGERTSRNQSNFVDEELEQAQRGVFRALIEIGND